MKKLLFALMTVAAITLTSCLGKTETPGQAAGSVEAPAEAADVAPALEQDLKSGDATTFTARINAIVEKVKELVGKNPGIAKEYLTKAQDFLKNNQQQVQKLIGGSEEAKGVIDMLTNTNPVDFLKSIAPNINLDGLVDKLPEGAKDVVNQIPGLGK